MKVILEDVGTSISIRTGRGHQVVVEAEEASNRTTHSKSILITTKGVLSFRLPAVKHTTKVRNTSNLKARQLMSKNKTLHPRRKTRPRS